MGWRDLRQGRNSAAATRDCLGAGTWYLGSDVAVVGSRAGFLFNRRGVYLLDRWIVAGLSERLTYHVVVTVRGAAPVASVTGTTYLAVGEVAELDARASSSAELRTLTYRWQLATRPALSQLVLPLEDTDDAMLSIVPDVDGLYLLEVVVFDGELWSEPATILVEGHD